MKSYFTKYQVQQKIHLQKEASTPKEAKIHDIASAKKELFESKFANLIFHLSDSVMEINWKGFIDHDSYRNILHETFSAIIERNIKKVIFNATDLEALTDENREWTCEHWFSKANDKDIKTFAFIMPKDIFGEVSLKMISEKIATLYNIKSKYFDNTDDALRWIVRQ